MSEFLYGGLPLFIAVPSYYEHHSESMILCTPEEVDPITREYDLLSAKRVPPNIIKDITQANKFVICDKPCNNEYWRKKYKKLDDKYFINAPFDLCWFEGLNSIELFQVNDSDDKNIVYCSGLLIDQRDGRDDLILVCHGEEKFTKELVDNGVPHIFFIRATDSQRKVASIFLNLIKGHSGKVSVRKSQKIRLNNKKYRYRINSIVYISQTKKKLKCPLTNKTINWTHKWEVRGHWRNCQGLGKNRQGEYAVFNRTWILHHIKGDGELIKKTRLIKND